MTQDSVQPNAGFRFRSLVLTRGKRPGIVVWIALLFGLYCLGGAVLLPRWALPFLERALSDALGTQCVIGRLTVNPLSLRVCADDIVIPYPEAMVPEGTSPDFLRLGRIEAKGAFSSLPNRALVVDELRFVSPEIHVTRYKDGSMSPQRLFAAGDANKAAAPAPENGDRASGGGLFPLVIRNIVVQDGTLSVADKVNDADYAIRSLDLAVPFASTLDSDKDVALTPRLSALIGGKSVVIEGETRPFARTRQTVFTLRTRELDLPEFRKFITPYTRLTLQSGRLHTALTLRFEQNPEEALDFSLAGTVEITDLALEDTNGPVLTADRAMVDMENVVLGPRRVVINDVVLEKPEVVVRRLHDGSLDWPGFFLLPDDDARNEARAAAAAGANVPAPDAAAPDEKPAETTDALPVRLAVRNARLTNGKLTWHDASLPTPISQSLENVTATLTDVSTEEEGHAAFTLAFDTAGGQASFTASGRATVNPLRVDAAMEAKGLPIAPFTGYIGDALQELAVDKGTLSVSGDVAFLNPERTVRVSKGNVTLSSVRIGAAQEAEKTLLDAQRLEAAGIGADLAAQSVHVGSVTGNGLEVNLTRGKNGAILLPGQPDSPASAESPKAPAAVSPEASAVVPQEAPVAAPHQSSAVSPAGPVGEDARDPAPSAGSWKVNVDAVNITDSRLSLSDASLENPAALLVTELRVTGNDFATHDNKEWTIAVSGKPGNGGTLDLTARGNLSPLRLAFSGKMDAVDLRPLSPYLLEYSQLALSEGMLDGAFEGSVGHVPTGGSDREFALSGTLGLNSMVLVHGQREVFGWNRMQAEKFAYRAPAAGGGHLSVASFTLEAPRLSVVIGKDGVNSLQQALARPAVPASPESPPSPAPQDSPAPAASPDLPQQQETNPTASSGLAAIFAAFAIDSIRVTNGQAHYRDMRMTPPYSLSVDAFAATAGDLTLDPGKPTSVTVDLRLNGSPVTASGTMTSLLSSPSGKGAVKARDLDLARFTQFSEKYVGYPVKKGALTADVAVALDGRKLDVNNKIVIRGLDLGSKVESSDAPDMPLPAALALLRDRSGDIQLDLPVSGTLGDPEFRISGIVIKLIGNIVLKTITSPLAILDTLVTGTADLLTGTGVADAAIAFPMGAATLDRTAREALAKLGRELRRHPSVKLSVTGTADRAEKDALVDAWVAKSLRDMKYNSLPPEQKAKTSPDRVRISQRHNAQEYSEFLFALYKSLPFVKESRDPAVTSPPSTGAVMRILRTRRETTDEHLLLLAGARAQAVYDALTRDNAEVSPRVALQPGVIEESGDGGRVASFARVSAGR